MLAWLSVWREVQIVCIWPSWTCMDTVGLTVHSECMINMIVTLLYQIAKSGFLLLKLVINRIVVETVRWSWVQLRMHLLRLDFTAEVGKNCAVQSSHHEQQTARGMMWIDCQSCCSRSVCWLQKTKLILRVITRHLDARTTLRQLRLTSAHPSLLHVRTTLVFLWKHNSDFHLISVTVLAVDRSLICVGNNSRDSRLHFLWIVYYFTRS